MIPIDKKLTSIRGISEGIARRLEAQGITTLADLQAKTSKPEDRQALSQAIEFGEGQVYVWAKQADLMRIEGIDGPQASLLIKAGIRNTADLAEADTGMLKQLLDMAAINENVPERERPTAAKLEAWKLAAGKLQPQIINSLEDKRLDVVIQRPDFSLDTMIPSPPIPFHDIPRPKTVEGTFFADLTEVMVEIGRGIAQAQHELNISSMEIQNHIDAHENLRNYGLMATWYALPETTFEMKVNYAVVQKKESEGKIEPSKAVRMAPINATYQNFFKSTTNTESQFRFKVVPVPPPVHVSEPVVVPDLSGLTLDEAKNRLRDARLRLGEMIHQSGTPTNDQDTQVVQQSIAAGTEVRINDVVAITYIGKAAPGGEGGQ